MAGGLGGLVVELSANIGRFTSAMTQANYVAQQNTRAIVKEVGSMRASFDSIPGSIARIAVASGGLYAVGTALKAGIKAADEFKMSVIGIAAGITNIAKPGQGDFATIFKRNVIYAEEMNKELMKVAAKTPATSIEMTQAYNQLVQQGYAARLNEAEALGVIVTKIKLATAGQDSNKQINQEIRAVMQGQAVAGSMIAQELETRLGPGWAAIVKSHQEAGDLLQWWAKMYPGVVEAGKLYENTLEGQKTTLEDNLKLLGREGLAGAYDDIVGLVKSVNDYLKEHGTELAGNIQTAWAAIKEIAGGVVLVVSEIVGWFKTGWGYLEGWRSSLSAIAAQRADLGVGMGLDLGAGLGAGPEWEVGGGSGATASQEAVIAQVKRNNDALAKETERYKKETYSLYLKDLGPIQTQSGAGKSKGGGGGKGGGADSARKEMDALAKEVEKARKDAMSSIDEVWKFNWDLHQQFMQSIQNRVKLESDAIGKISVLWESVMNDETMSYSDRLQAANKYRIAHVKVIDKEITDIKEKYKDLITTDALDKYRQTQIDVMEKAIKKSTVGSGFSTIMGDVGTAIGGAISRTITATIRGQEITFAEIGWGIGEAFINKSIELATSALKPLFEGFMQSAGNILMDSIGGLFGGGGGDGIFGTLMGIGESIVGFLGFHDGGMGANQRQLIYAHSGLPPLQSNEFPAILRNDERVLSPRETRAYEAGKSMGGGGGGFSIGAIHIDARGASKDVNWDHVVKRQIIPQLDQHLRKRGYQKISGGR